MGRDKRLIRFNGKTLLEGAISLLEAVCPGSPILAGNNLTRIAPSGYRILPDAQAGCGPLGGLVAALGDCPTPWALVIGVDMPLLTPKVLKSLIQAPRMGFQGVCLSCGDILEPLAAIYAREGLEYWRKRLEAGEFSLTSGIEELCWKSVLIPNGNRAMLNVNQQQDLASLFGE